jgi:hypothetical protein
LWGPAIKSENEPEVLLSAKEIDLPGPCKHVSVGRLASAIVVESKIYTWGITNEHG